jgi:RNA polymerase sigma-70 factor (ECF subfamily)
MNDADLLREFRNGNKEVFSELVSRYSKPLTMMILRIVRDPEDARDISQMAFLKAYEGLHKFMMVSSIKTWLYTIALNAMRDHLRKRKAILVPDMLDQLVDPAEPAEEALDRERKLERIRRALDTLPEKQRLTVQLRIYEEMDYKEIAKVLGGTEGGARGNFFQAVKSLREKLGSK